MFGLDDLLGGVGDIAGYFAGSGDRNAANQALANSLQGWSQIDPTIQAQQTGPSAYNGAGADSRAAQMDVLSNLKNKYSSGGLDAIDRGRVADIDAATAAAGRTAGGAARDIAARHGMLNSATGLVQGTQAGQQAAEVAARQGTAASAEAEAARRASMNQAGYMAGQTRGQDYERAAAQDAIQRFNAGQRQAAENQTVQGRFQRAGGMSDVYGQQYGAHQADARRTQGLYGGIGRMAGGVANYFMPGGGGGGVPGYQSEQDAIGGAG